MFPFPAVADRAGLEAIETPRPGVTPASRRQGLAQDTARKLNNIGFLRLLLASLVIIGHGPEIIDGDRRREPLTMIFHTLSLGEAAVDGFFLISGYLIAMSMARSSSLASFMSRRVLRIYPAYVVAFLIAVLVVAPLAGGKVDEPLRSITRMALLQTPPAYAGQFAGLPMPDLNGAMWTISYEFRCYLLVGALGICGVLGRRRALGLMTIAALAIAVSATFPSVRHALDAADQRLHAQAVIGSLAQTVRLNAIFLVGVCGYAFRDRLMAVADGRSAFVATVLMTMLMLIGHVAELAVATLGGYALFWLAFKADLGGLRKINDGWDISYGVYLYGWPVAILLLWYNRGISPVSLALATFPIALMLGAASWWGVERWSSRLGRTRAPQ